MPSTDTRAALVERLRNLAVMFRGRSHSATIHDALMDASEELIRQRSEVARLAAERDAWKAALRRVEEEAEQHYVHCPGEKCAKRLEQILATFVMARNDAANALTSEGADR